MRECQASACPNMCHAPEGASPNRCQHAPPGILLTGKGSLQATLEERLNRSEETRKTFRHFLIEVARGSENTKNGRNIPAKVRDGAQRKREADKDATLLCRAMHSHQVGSASGQNAREVAGRCTPTSGQRQWPQRD